MVFHITFNDRDTNSLVQRVKGHLKCSRQYCKHMDMDMVRSSIRGSKHLNSAARNDVVVGNIDASMSMDHMDMVMEVLEVLEVIEVIQVMEHMDKSDPDRLVVGVLIVFALLALGDKRITGETHGYVAVAPHYLLRLVSITHCLAQVLYWLHLNRPVLLHFDGFPLETNNSSNRMDLYRVKIQSVFLYCLFLCAQERLAVQASTARQSNLANSLYESRKKSAENTQFCLYSFISFYQLEFFF